MTCHCPDLGSASDWLKQICHATQPIRIWVAIRHHYGISVLVSQTSFRGETSGGVAKCRRFSQATRKRTVSKQTWSQPCFHQRLLIVFFFLPALSRALSGIDHVNLEEYTVHVVAGVLKLFFRQLSVPVITSDFYMDFIRTAGECKKITFYCCFFSLRNPRCFKG